MKKRFTEEQIIGFLREADAGLWVKELRRKHGFSDPANVMGSARYSIPSGTVKAARGYRLNAAILGTFWRRADE